MKQHITPEQLNELTDKGKERLRERWKPKQGDWFWKEGENGKLNFLLGNPSQVNSVKNKDRKGALPLLSIGQMIEFLSERNREYVGVNIEPFIESTNKGFLEVKSTDGWCDSLWEAVKEVLNG